MADFIGLDTCLSIMQVLHEGVSPFQYRVSAAVKYVEAGWLGRKTQRGFLRLSGTSRFPSGEVFTCCRSASPGRRFESVNHRRVVSQRRSISYDVASLASGILTAQAGNLQTQVTPPSFKSNADAEKSASLTILGVGQPFWPMSRRGRRQSQRQGLNLTFCHSGQRLRVNPESRADIPRFRVRCFASSGMMVRASWPP